VLMYMASDFSTKIDNVVQGDWFLHLQGESLALGILTVTIPSWLGQRIQIAI